MSSSNWKIAKDLFFLKFRDFNLLLLPFYFWSFALVESTSNFKPSELINFFLWSLYPQLKHWAINIYIPLDAGFLFYFSKDTQLVIDFIIVFIFHWAQKPNYSSQQWVLKCSIQRNLKVSLKVEITDHLPQILFKLGMEVGQTEITIHTSFSCQCTVVCEVWVFKVVKFC